MSGRVPRTHPSQWSTLVDFIVQHPEIVTHKFVGVNGRENFNKLWEELTIVLNSMGFGTKDSKKWQEVFGKWKSKIKVKAQEIQCGIKKTGGGGPLPQLTPIEEKLMGVIGWKLVTGDGNVEMGVENAFIIQNTVANQNLEGILATDIEIPEPDVDLSWEMPTTSRGKYSSVLLDVPPLIYMNTTNNIPQPDTEPPTITNTKSVTVEVTKKKKIENSLVHQKKETNTTW